MELVDSRVDPRREDDRTSALVERLFQDAVGALELFTIYLGERLGLYRARFLNLLGKAWLPAIADLHQRLCSEPPACDADVACGDRLGQHRHGRGIPTDRR
jgi:hypothetical protein